MGMRGLVERFPNPLEELKNNAPEMRDWTLSQIYTRQCFGQLRTRCLNCNHLPKLLVILELIPSTTKFSS